MRKRVQDQHANAQAVGPADPELEDRRARTATDPKAMTPIAAAIRTQRRTTPATSAGRE